MKNRLSLKSTAFLVFGIEILMIIIAIGRAILLERNPMRYFDEGGFITWLSIGQLLFIAYLCWRISIFRDRQHSLLRGWKNPSRLWQVMTAGFIYLALDEGLQIHENIDLGIHKLLNLNDTGATDRIDDFIILIYAIIGLVLLWTFKNEFQQFTSAFRWFLTGFSLSFLTIALDMLSHKRATLSPFIEDYDQLIAIHTWFQTLEEIPKILAEGAFIIAFYYCLIIATRLNNRTKKDPRK